MASIGRLPMEWIDYNLYNSISSPSTVHCENTELVWFLERYLVQKCMSVFKFTLPEEVDETYFLYVLFVNGWIVLANDDKFGPVAHYASLSGSNLYYHPKNATISFADTDASLSHNLDRIIDPLDPNRDAILMKLQKNYGGFMDLVSFYAERMALCLESFDMNILNSHLAYVFGSDSKTLSETFKKAYDDISGGNPCIVIDRDMFDEDGKPKWMAFFNNLKQNFIANDILLALSKIEKEFDTKIGIPSANTDKRERLTDDEVNSNNVETLTFIELCLRDMKGYLKEAVDLGIWPKGDVELVVPTLEETYKSAKDKNKIGGQDDGQLKTDSNRIL